MASVVRIHSSIRCVSWSVFIWLICCDARLLIWIRCLPWFRWVLLPFIVLLLWNLELLLKLVNISVCFVDDVSTIPTTMWVTFICIVSGPLAHLWLLQFDLFLYLLDLTYLLFLLCFHHSVWFLWLISHSRLAVLLVLASIKFQWHSCSWWCRLEIMVLWELLRMNLRRNKFSLALWSLTSLHLLVWENDMWLFIRWLIVLVDRHLIRNLHGTSREVILTHLHLWWIWVLWNPFINTWDVCLLLWWNLVCS